MIFLNLKIEKDPFEYFDSALIEHTKKNRQTLGAMYNKYGTCMVAAVNLYTKQRLYQNNEELYQQNNYLLKLKKIGIILIFQENTLRQKLSSFCFHTNFSLPVDPFQSSASPFNPFYFVKRFFWASILSLNVPESSRTLPKKDYCH